MYQGALFKKALRYAKQRYQRVFILSAKHGVLQLDEIIKPYNITLNTFTKREQKEWAEKVKRQLIEKQIKPPYLFLAGENYCRNLPIGERPLQSLSLGQQLQWFNRRERRGFSL